VCNGFETCDPSLGCKPGPGLDCDDQSPCTKDLCHPKLGCVHMLCTQGVDCPPSCPDPMDLCQEDEGSSPAGAGTGSDDGRAEADSSGEPTEHRDHWREDPADEREGDGQPERWSPGDVVEAVPCCQEGGLDCDPIPEAQDCVCDHDEYCCEQGWDSSCVVLVATCGAGCDSCCTAHETPGCQDSAEVSSCVCAIDDSCCSESWSVGCVVIATEACGLNCDPFDYEAESVER